MLCQDTLQYQRMGVACHSTLPKTVMEYSSTVLVLEYYSNTTFGVLVLAIPGTRLVLVFEGQCTRYSVKKSAEYTSTFGFRWKQQTNKQDELSIANYSQ